MYAWRRRAPRTSERGVRQAAQFQLLQSAETERVRPVWHHRAKPALQRPQVSGNFDDEPEPDRAERSFARHRDPARSTHRCPVSPPTSRPERAFCPLLLLLRWLAMLSNQITNEVAEGFLPGVFREGPGNVTGHRIRPPGAYSPVNLHQLFFGQSYRDFRRCHTSIIPRRRFLIIIRDGDPPVLRKKLYPIGLVAYDKGLRRLCDPIDHAQSFCCL